MPELPPWVPDRQRAIGDRIRRHRLAANLTQDRLAQMTGLDRRTVQRVERYDRDARLSWLLLIADAIGVPVGQLLEMDPAAADTGAAGDSGA